MTYRRDGIGHRIECDYEGCASALGEDDITRADAETRTEADLLALARTNSIEAEDIPEMMASGLWIATDAGRHVCPLHHHVSSSR